MRSSETVLKIQGLIDSDRYNEVKDEDISADMSHEHNDTMLIHENIEMAATPTLCTPRRKDTSLNLKQFQELLKTYQHAMDSLNKPPEQTSLLETPSKPIKPEKSESKCNCTIYILIIAVMYSVLCSSYFLYCIIFHSQNFLFFLPNNTMNNTPIIVYSSTPNPTLNPTEIGMQPTLEPTLEPTMEPILYEMGYDLMKWDIGDYKISTQIKSHGNWLLCDGTLYNISDYKTLFDIIGYVFTEKNIYNNNKTVFAVPDATDKNIGIYGGTKYSFGDIISNDIINSTVVSDQQTIFIGKAFIYS